MAFPKAVRRRILRRDPTCRCTGCRHHNGPCASPSTIADHIVPKAEGGSDQETNGQGLCAPCHDEKTRAEAARGRARRSRKRPTTTKHPGFR